MNPLHPTVLTGDNVFRIHWILGTDRLLAVCHCGAEREFEDPVLLWDWLLGHPNDHRAGPESEPAVAPQPLHEVFA
ncbi:hypothetical protein [Streptomyces ochraceiscleroticus]|uniref:Uncharacterized protein n=1 Tax=Streptomyces ochraceiscleroticus TaxID=47761 RepID=A0ABW1MKV5_9ACTN|nr:hypothetical protein [Streptomyces ochraceiscleroticus]